MTHMLESCRKINASFDFTNALQLISSPIKRNVWSAMLVAGRAEWHAEVEEMEKMEDE